MSAPANKTTMSVAEMRRILGLKKTDGYWLVKKNEFPTIMVQGKMRIAISSFEKWYDNQMHYRKVDGPDPKVCQRTYSIADIEKLLDVSEETVREIIRRDGLTLIKSSYHSRISKAEFYEWYHNQDHYRMRIDRERDRNAEESSMTFSEMGRLLNIDRRVACTLAQKTDELEVIIIAGRKRVTKKSFETWYQSQSIFRIREDCVSDNQEKALKQMEGIWERNLPETFRQDESVELEIVDTWCTMKQAASVLRIGEQAIVRLIQSGEIKGKKISNSWRVFTEDVLWLHSQKKKETEVR